jgi:hypothetical protein
MGDSVTYAVPSELNSLIFELSSNDKQMSFNSLVDHLEQLKVGYQPQRTTTSNQHGDLGL